MNIAELSKAVADRTDLSAAEARAVVGAVLDEIVAQVAAGETVTLAGFGTFEARDRAARDGRSPRTGETVHIPATRVPAFRAFTPFKEKVKTGA